MAKDIIPDLIRQVLEAAGADVALSSAIEPRIRQAFGGERHYFARTMPEKKTYLVGVGYALGLTTSEIADMVLMPERTVRWHASRRLRGR